MEKTEASGRFTDFTEAGRGEGPVRATIERRIEDAGSFDYEKNNVLMVAQN